MISGFDKDLYTIYFNSKSAGLNVLLCDVNTGEIYQLSNVAEHFTSKVVDAFYSNVMGGDFDGDNEIRV